MTRVVVLGSNSFSGAHFVHHLLEHVGAEVLGISRSPEPGRVFLPYRYQNEQPAGFRFLQADLNQDMERTVDAITSFGPTVVVNYAAQGEVRNSWKWPAQWFRTNALAVVELAQALKTWGRLERYVAISTPEVYGSTPDGLKENNEHFSPATPYAASKLAGDLFLMTLDKEGSLPVTWVRSANVYGPHQQLFRIIPKTILTLRDGGRLPLHNRGQTRRAFLAMEDAAAGTWLAATQGEAGGVYHLAPEDGVLTIGELVRSICDALGCDFDASTELVDENFGQDALYHLDAARARDELGWRCKVSLDEGVASTVRWIDDNLEQLRGLPRHYEHKV